MKAWLKNLTQREQIYLLLALAALLLYTLVALWRPLAASRDALAARNAEVAQQLRRVRAMAGELQQISAGRGGASQINLNPIINSSSNAVGIRPTRIQPNARGEVQVRFEDVGFAPLLRWLHRVEAVDGVRVREVAISQGERGGVRAAVLLGQGG